MTAGSPARVEIGRIAKVHGLRGEVVVTGSRLTVEETRGLGAVEARGKSGELRRLVIASVRPFMHSLLMCFEGVEDRDQAAALSGNVLEVDPAQLPSPGEGNVYLFQLLGLAVETESGEALGRVREVLQTGATPILIVDGPVPLGGGKPRERMLPMSPDVLVGVDRAGGRITVRLLPGMEDL